jgi:hypothetical protein
MEIKAQKTRFSHRWQDLEQTLGHEVHRIIAIFF